MRKSFQFLLFPLIYLSLASPLWADSFMSGFGGDDGFSDFFSSRPFSQKSGRTGLVSLDMDPQNILDSSFRVAAREGRLKHLKELLMQGANINSRSASGETALMSAARNCSSPLVEFLIAKGAQVNLKDAEGRTPLMRAAGESCLKVVEMLLKAPAIEVGAKDRMKKTAMDYAAENALLEVDGPSQRIIREIKKRERLQQS